MLVLVGALVLAGAAVTPRPAAALSAPTSILHCVPGVVIGSAPTVAAQQWSSGPDVQWQAELWIYTSEGWQLHLQSDFRTAEVMNTDFNPGGTGGVAGPSWWSPLNQGFYTYVYFTPPSGYWYAIKNVVWEAGTSSAAWATLIGRTDAWSCQA